MTLDNSTITAILGQAVAANDGLNGSQLNISPAGIYSNNGGFSLSATGSAVAVWAQTTSGVLTINAQRYIVQ